MAAHPPPHHEISLPAFNHPAFPTDLAALPASTRTSYTRVDLTRPGTSAGDADRLERLSNDDSHSSHSASSSHSDSGGEDGGEEPQEELVSVPVSPMTSLTFLLVSGRRRAMVFEPETTVGRVKELVWNTWPNDWQDERPPAPSFLRILYLGKILQDDETLSHLSFPTHLPTPHTPAPNATPAAPPPSTIVHLSIRAYAPPEDAGYKKKKIRLYSGGTTQPAAAAGVGAEEEVGGCCCVIC
ncbi:hypothetical protein BV25DRAFT_1913845 [Artomyces pyxidatus]|uniref:Uncharacterized protein n=1 Tax=Artomyces pyxidatus TaxID=48021 RepID=A0ACB8TAN2_9AGAM|nr:hypothetical protein BV25DRAFT_1913845 [Artomyces pyxidatus]